MTTIRPDPEEIKRAVALFLEPGAIIELRLPKTERDGTVSGYFSDAQHLVDAARTARGPGVYVTLNRIPTDLLARADNRVKTRVRETTSDKEVTRRLKLLLDFDPPRAAGISATDAEHEAAIQAARDARKALGWPEPVLADSGNGGHLIYAIDLPNDEESTSLVKLVLKAAAQRFNTPRVQVDTSVFNASRISKLYGTVAAKGDSTADRPHRLSRILEMPDCLLPVSPELLKALASEVYQEPPPSTQFHQQGNYPAFDLEKFLSEHGIQVRIGPVVNNGSEMWRLEECPFDSAHGIDATLFRRSNGALAFKCFHDGCADKRWQDFRAHYEPIPAQRAQKPLKSQTFTNGPAAHTAGNALPAEDQIEAKVIKIDTKDKALQAIAAAVEAKDPQKCWAPELIQAIARGGTAREYDALRAFKAAYPKDFVGNVKGWQALIREAQAEDGFNAGYVRSDNGGLIANIANAITMMGELPIGWDEFSFRASLTASAPWGTLGIWSDHDDVKAAEWCQRQGLNVKSTTIAEASTALSHDNPFHPVRQYLERLKWDNTPRLDMWLVEQMGCVDSEYIRLVGAKWMISAVARVMEPGCQADYTLVFEGGQGRYKSSALRILGGKWFADDLTDIGTKDSAIQLQGKWIIEISELDAFKKADMTTIKAWLVRREDHFRPPYGRRAEDFPRQNVFAASTNKDDWGQDDTGLRRFWPIRTGKIKLAELQKIRDQLWAEAFSRYSSGEIYYLAEKQEEAARVEQDLRQNVDAWRDGIEDWLEDPDVRHVRDTPDLPMRSDPPRRVYNADILWHCLGLQQKDWNHSHKMRISRIMRLAGYALQRTPRKEDGRRPEFWAKMAEETQPTA